MEGDGLRQVATWPAIHGTGASLTLEGRCLHVAYVAAALGALGADTLETSSSIDACGPLGAHGLWTHTLINILTALPISQDPVSAGAGTAVGARGVHTGVHAEPGASFLPVDLTLIHILADAVAARGAAQVESRLAAAVLLLLHLRAARRAAEGGVAGHAALGGRSLGLMLTAVPSSSWRTDASVLVDSFHTRPTVVTRLAGACPDVSAMGLFSSPGAVSKTHHTAGTNQPEPRVAGKMDFMVHQVLASELLAIRRGVQSGAGNWRCIWGHFAHSVLQGSQPTLHVSDAFSEAGLLALQQLLQLADGCQELLFVETALGSPRSGAGEEQQEKDERARRAGPHLAQHNLAAEEGRSLFPGRP